MENMFPVQQARTMVLRSHCLAAENCEEVTAVQLQSTQQVPAMNIASCTVKTYWNHLKTG